MTLATSQVVEAQPFPAEKNQALAQQFMREGYLLVPAVLTPQEVAGLKERIDRILDDPQSTETDVIYGARHSVRLFEKDNMFRDMLAREPIISLMETILGADCHVIANSVLRNPPGAAISKYHVDGPLWFPLPPELPRFDARMTYPCLALNCQIPLSDLESDEFGPTEVVPGSHYSGRQPNDEMDPQFEGRKGVTIHCQAGDIYLQHAMVWHRGHPNTSTRTRYLLQQSYSVRYIAQRFYPFMNYQVPDQTLEGASNRVLRLLGKHVKSWYG